MNLPNIITILRVLSIPLLVIFLMEGNFNYALFLFTIAAVSDAIDGFLARILKQQTTFGAYADPIADKLLIGTSYVTLSILQIMPGWLTVLVISRDVIILSGFGIIFLSEKKIEISPNIDSKLTTCIQLLTIFYFLGYERLVPFHFAHDYMLFFTAAFTVFSGFHYIQNGFVILGQNSDGPSQSRND
ncbi:MAG: CDP-alcohol phosphatidyltransferase family protein [Desulfobulbaceae bacterium]|nr:CDP-alcohol phosphatidyltransferase family protein [Desulfobulbaceae bacterium]